MRQDFLVYTCHVAPEVGAECGPMELWLSECACSYLEEDDPEFEPRGHALLLQILGGGLDVVSSSVELVSVDHEFKGIERGVQRLRPARCSGTGNVPD